MKDYKGQKVLVRGTESGVYFGEMAELNGQTAELRNARNLWYWSGANCLMDLAKDGVSRPQSCQFSVVVESIVLTDICEVLPCTKEAIKSIEDVKEWTC